MSTKIETYQDSLGHHHAVVVDSDGVGLVTMPRADQYGKDTAEEARQLAEKFVAGKERAGVDIEGGGVR